MRDQHSVVQVEAPYTVPFIAIIHSCTQVYVWGGIKACKYPLLCPASATKGCDRLIVYRDVLRLLKDCPEELQVWTGSKVWTCNYASIRLY